MILAVDCGINFCGVAVFEGTELYKAWLEDNTAASTESSFARSVAMGRAVADSDSLACNVRDAIDTVVVEWQQIYTARKSKGDANVSVLPLVGVAAAIGALFPDAKLVQYLPREWKGTIDADEMTERIYARLTARETVRYNMAPASKMHNVVDAIGIGLKYVGRLEKRRFISRGTP